VTVTETARQLQKLEEAVAKSPVMNAEKVQAVKDALARDALPWIAAAFLAATRANPQ